MTNKERARIEREAKTRRFINYQWVELERIRQGIIARLSG